MNTSSQTFRAKKKVAERIALQFIGRLTDEQVEAVVHAQNEADKAASLLQAALNDAMMAVLNNRPNW